MNNIIHCVVSSKKRQQRNQTWRTIKLVLVILSLTFMQASAKGNLKNRAISPLNITSNNFDHKILLAEIQQVIITGKVVDEDGKPLPGATVKEKGTKNYVQTDNDGNFNIKVSQSGAILIFSYIGYNSHEAPASSSMKITLRSNNKLDEVVVTGYQQIKKESLTGSVARVKVADIKVASMGTLDKMLQGQVAGVTVENNSSIFGTAPKIRIRGSSSLSGINEPLWVLDDVALEAPLRIAPSELYSGGARNLLASALSSVNPEDIEDITVLKDATATAMYGTRAVNGVIVITTKRAKKNMPLVINYNSNATVTLKPTINDFDVLNSKDQTILNEEIFNTYQNSLMTFSAETSGAYSKLTYLRNVKALTDEGFRNAVRDLKDAVVEIILAPNVNFVSADVILGGGTATWVHPTNFTTYPGGKIIWNKGNILLPTDPNSIIGKLKYKVRVTNNCALLTTSASNCAKTIALPGKISGTGTISSVAFESKLIIGHSDGVCEGNSIEEPFTMYINVDNTFTASCPKLNEDGAKLIKVCAGAILRNYVMDDYPLGTLFYSQVPGSPNYEASIVTGNFITDQSGKIKKFYAVVPGIDVGCYLKLETLYGGCVMMSNPMIQSRFLKTN